MSRYLEIKPGSISEVAKKLHDDYQAYFKKELEKTGKSIAQMTDAEKKSFFNRVDKGYNAKNEQDDIKKAPGRHSQMKGKLLLEPRKEATSQDISASLATKPKAEPKTTLVAAPGGKEKVVRIPIEKLADYKKKGYVEAEEFVPEQAKNPYAIGMAAAMKATGDKPPLKKSTIVKAHDIAKSIEKKEEIKEAGMKEIDTTNQEIKRLRVRLQQLRDAENAAAGADTTNIEKQIHQTRSAILDLQKKQLQKQEDSDADKMNKKQKDVKGEEEVINKLKEGKMNYKSYKKSLKNEETPKNLKKTMTGQPVTKIDTQPKLSHN
jgi:ribosomal protein S17E